MDNSMDNKHASRTTGTHFFACTSVTTRSAAGIPQDTPDNTRMPQDVSRMPQMGFTDIADAHGWD